MSVIGNPSGEKLIARMISASDFCEDFSFFEAEVASKLFVVLDNRGVSMVDVKKGSGKMILHVAGSNNRGILMQ